MQIMVLLSSPSLNSAVDLYSRFGNVPAVTNTMYFVPANKLKLYNRFDGLLGRFPVDNMIRGTDADDNYLSTRTILGRVDHHTKYLW